MPREHKTDQQGNTEKDVDKKAEPIVDQRLVAGLPEANLSAQAQSEVAAVPLLPANPTKPLHIKSPSIRVQLKDTGTSDLASFSGSSNAPVSLRIAPMEKDDDTQPMVEKPTLVAKEICQAMERIPQLEGEVSPACWFAFLDLLINSDLFKKGIVAIAPNSEDFPKEKLADADKFTLTSRTLFFGKPTDKSFKITDGLFKKLQSFGEAGAAQASLAREDAAIFNPKRREEVFLPLTFLTGNTQQSKVGSYIYPWLSKSTKDFEFTGFEQFVTAGHMFGANLRGVNQIDAGRPLVKHDIKFLSGEKIVRIEFKDQEANLYEEMIFAELEKQASLIDKLAKAGQEKHLYFHLPYGDYMLFGIELFIQGRMTLKALNQMFTTILKKKEAYAERVAKIFNAHGIVVKIESPFDNLFGELDFTKCPKDKIAQVLLERLGLSCAEVPPELDIERLKETEMQFVANCLQILQRNELKKNHQQVWQDFMSTTEKPPQTIEGLFRVANAAMIALASMGKPDFTTCSLLPLSEKQIQLEYQRYSKQCKNYPGIFNITTLDPIAGYSEENPDELLEKISKGLLEKMGLLFYFADIDCKRHVAKLISKYGILNHAHANVARFAANEPSIPIQQILPEYQP